MSFSGNWVFQMHMENSLIDARLRVPLVHAPWVCLQNRWIIMWMGDPTLEEQLCMPHRKRRFKSKGQAPGNRPIRIGNGTFQLQESCADSKLLVLRLLVFYKCIDFVSDWWKFWKRMIYFLSDEWECSNAKWNHVLYLNVLTAKAKCDLFWICVVTVWLLLNLLDKVTSYWPPKPRGHCFDQQKEKHKKLCHKRQANTEANSCEFCTDHANCCRLCKVIIW